MNMGMNEIYMCYINPYCYCHATYQHQLHRSTAIHKSSPMASPWDSKMAIRFTIQNLARSSRSSRYISHSFFSNTMNTTRLPYWFSPIECMIIGILDAVIVFLCSPCLGLQSMLLHTNSISVCCLLNCTMCSCVTTWLYFNIHTIPYVSVDISIFIILSDLQQEVFKHIPAVYCQNKCFTF